MKKFLTYMMILFFSIFGVMGFANYIVDPANVYSDAYIYKCLEGPKNGLNTTNAGNMNERLYKLGLCRAYKNRKFDYLALGSSRVMTVSEDVMKGKALLNLGVSGCKLEDMIALTEICREYNIKYDSVIIALDATFFNGNHKDTRWKSLIDFYEIFMNQKKNPKYVDIDKVENLISVSYFKESLTELKNRLNEKPEVEYVPSVINDGFTLRYDGSIYYDKKYREVAEDIVTKDAKTFFHSSYEDFDSFSEERKSLFEKLIYYFMDNNIGFYFLEAPYHEIFYDRLSKMNGVVESWKFINGYSHKNNIKVIGSFNPRKVGFRNSDFYDANHPKKESLDRLMDKYFEK